MREKFDRKINTRKSVKTMKNKRYRIYAVFTAVLCFLLLLIAAAFVCYIVFRPYKIRSIEYISDDSSFESFAAEYAEEYIGREVFSKIRAGRVRFIEEELTHCLPEYKDIAAEFNFGGKLTISAKRRSNFIVFSCGDMIVVTDKDGYVMLISDGESYKKEMENVPSYDGDSLDVLIKGLDVLSCTLGEKIAINTKIEWKKTAEVYFTVLANEALEKNVRAIFFSQDNTIYLGCRDKLYVELPSCDDDTLFAMLERANIIFSQESSSEFKDGTITMAKTGRDTFTPNKSGNESAKIEEEH